MLDDLVARIHELLVFRQNQAGYNREALAGLRSELAQARAAIPPHQVARPTAGAAGPQRPVHDRPPQHQLPGADRPPL